MGSNSVYKFSAMHLGAPLAVQNFASKTKEVISGSKQFQFGLELLFYLVCVHV